MNNRIRLHTAATAASALILWATMLISVVWWHSGFVAWWNFVAAFFATQSWWSLLYCAQCRTHDD